MIFIPEQSTTIAAMVKVCALRTYETKVKGITALPAKTDPVAATPGKPGVSTVTLFRLPVSY